MGELDHGIAGDAFEDVVRRGRSKKFPIENKEDILTTSFRDMSILSQQDSLIVAIFPGFGLGQSTVDIQAGDLGPWWDHIVINTTPTGDAASGPLLRVEIWTEGYHKDEEVILQVVKPYAYSLGTLICQRSDIDVFLVAILFHQFHSDLGQLISAVGQVDLQDVATLQHSLVVFPKTEEIHLILLAIPVASNAFEAGCPIVESMGHDAYLGFRERRKLFIEEGKLRHGYLLLRIQETGKSDLIWQKGSVVMIALSQVSLCILA
jgi:hypothetical protein